mmetsp:Transcript_34753/g.84009  ORF Transcript_34753/g.84009 Transcript_34753/m.84009 type:complete len:128 (-) Transcript_34753:83-466(-)
MDDIGKALRYDGYYCMALGSFLALAPQAKTMFPPLPGRFITPLGGLTAAWGLLLASEVAPVEPKVYAPFVAGLNGVCAVGLVQLGKLGPKPHALGALGLQVFTFAAWQGSIVMEASERESAASEQTQ